MSIRIVAIIIIAVCALACGGDAWQCVDTERGEACVREVCADEGPCHFEVTSQAMTKADLIDRITPTKPPVPDLKK